MMFIIDGTGEYSDKEYTKSMSGGFCKQLEKHTKGFYHRGPVLDGSDTYKIADLMLDKYLPDGVSPPREDLYLAGHSRGGAAVIYMAQKLKVRKIKVRAMFLFDAVDRVFAMGPLDLATSLLTRGLITPIELAIRQAELPDVSTVPENVAVCYHARRDTEDKSISRYFESGLKAALASLEQCNKTNGVGSFKCNAIINKVQDLREQDQKMKYCMRETNMPMGLSIDFGNCGTKSNGRYVQERFLGSHGAMGGAPICDEHAPRLLIDADRAAVASVNAWMRGKMIAEQVFLGFENFQSVGPNDVERLLSRLPAK